MASKFMVNAAFEARLLLRPSHQRTVLFGTVNKLECPIPGRPTLSPILSSRSYSDSTSTPPFPKSSGSTEGSQSSGPGHKNWFSRKAWGKTLGWGAIGITWIGYVTQATWKDWYRTFRRRVHESARESAIYDKLKKGPVFQEAIEHTIPRQPLVEEIRQLLTPVKRDNLYPLIVGECGTENTRLIKLAVNGMDEPKGIVYVDIPIECDSEVDVTNELRNALGWSPDQLIDSSQSTRLWPLLRAFTDFAIKYEQEYKRVPVLIIDNANRLAQKQPRLLDLFQDYAKSNADNGTVSVIFVSSEGRIPGRMIVRSSWSRSGHIIEIGDISKAEALQYLKFLKINEEQAAQIYELVGGRMTHLKFIADEIKRHGTPEAVRQTMFSDARSQLESAEILPGCRYHKGGAVILRELLKKESISCIDYGKLDFVTGPRYNAASGENAAARPTGSYSLDASAALSPRPCDPCVDPWAMTPVKRPAFQQAAGDLAIRRPQIQDSSPSSFVHQSITPPVSTVVD